MKKKMMAISDIHGMFPQLVTMLDSTNLPDSGEGVIFLGDYMDRGKHNLLAMDSVMHLVESMPDRFRALRGNHDQMFLDFFQAITEEDIFSLGHNYMYNGGAVTVKSILGLSDDADIDILEAHEALNEDDGAKAIAKFIRGLDYYYEFGKVLFSHAGVPVYHGENWKNTTNQEFIWNRSTLLPLVENKSGKVLVFGHTPTFSIRGFNSTDRETINKDSDIYVNDALNKINIDGGCFHTGCLNGIVIDEDGLIISKRQARESADGKGIELFKVDYPYGGGE